MCCGVGCRLSLDPELLWLWYRLAAVTLIGPLAWEPPYAAGAALEKAKRQKKLSIYVFSTNEDLYKSLLYIKSYTLK